MQAKKNYSITPKTKPYFNNEGNQLVKFLSSFPMANVA